MSRYKYWITGSLALAATFTAIYYTKECKHTDENTVNSLGNPLGNVTLSKAAVCPATPPAAAARVDCPAGVNQAACANIDCCWSPLNVPGPWCYNPAAAPPPPPPPAQCPANPPAAAARVDCPAGVNQGACTNAGCCWSPLNVPGYWCYNPAAAPPPPPAQCPANPPAADARVDCPDGVNQGACTNAGCCWSPLNVPGPWCYNPAAAPPPPPAQCPATPPAPANRVDCPAGVNQGACTNAGCCWSPLNVPGPWCYNPTAAPPPPPAQCPANPPAADARVDCPAGVNQGACTNAGCCWSPLNVPGPWCYQVAAAPPNPNRPAACPPSTNPFYSAARIDCPAGGANEAACYNQGCCWDPILNGPGGPWCYTTKQNDGYGTPGSDPGVALNPTVANPGQFAIVATAPMAPLGVVLSPNTNKLVFLERTFNGVIGSTHSYTMDLTTFAFTPLNPNSDVFCVGGALMANGRVVAMGGWTGEDNLRAIRFLSPNADWVEQLGVTMLQRRRWYPTGQLLPDGKILVVGGATDIVPPGLNQPNAEFLPPTGPPITLQLLVNTDGNNLYPFIYLVPTDNIGSDLSVFIFAERSSQLFDLNLNVKATLPNAPGAIRNYPFYGSTAMIPLVFNQANEVPPMEILICGGNSGLGIDTPASNECVRTRPNLGAAAVWVQETMPVARVQADLVNLPDQNILIINGCTHGQAGFGLCRDPTLNAVLYNPRAPFGNRFSVLAASTIARLYHSEAILSLDGRVIVSGSTPNSDSNTPNNVVIHPTELRIEAFSPPYLTNGKARPTFTASTLQWTDNMQFTITATIPSGNPAGITVTIINQGFITHGAHMGAVQYVLAITNIQNNGNNRFTLTVLSPRNSNIVVHQYYTLWVVDDGTPSVGQWIKYGGNGNTPNYPGF